MTERENVIPYLIRNLSFLEAYLPEGKFRMTKIFVIADLIRNLLFSRFVVKPGMTVVLENLLVSS